MFDKIDKLKEDARETLTGSNPDNDLRACLHADHVKVDKLIDRLLAADAEDVRTREEIRDQIVVELTAHARAEEEVVYEHLMRWAETQGKTDHAFDEHDQIDRVLDVLRSIDVSDAGVPDIVRELKHVVTHHVHEEENDLLPKAEREIGQEELARLIEPFRMRKQELLPQLIQEQEVWSAGPSMSSRSYDRRNPLSESDSRY